MLVSRELTKLCKEFPELKIEKIDILSHPARSLKAGVRMIPTLESNGKRLTGFLLNSSDIRTFVQSVLNQTV